MPEKPSIPPEEPRYSRRKLLAGGLVAAGAAAFGLSRLDEEQSEEPAKMPVAPRNQAKKTESTERKSLMGQMRIDASRNVGDESRTKPSHTAETMADEEAGGPKPGTYEKTGEFTYESGSSDTLREAKSFLLGINSEGVEAVIDFGLGSVVDGYPIVIKIKWKNKIIARIADIPGEAAHVRVEITGSNKRVDIAVVDLRTMIQRALDDFHDSSE